LRLYIEILSVTML